MARSVLACLLHGKARQGIVACIRKSLLHALPLPSASGAGLVHMIANPIIRALRTMWLSEGEGARVRGIMCGVAAWGKSGRVFVCGGVNDASASASQVGHSLLGVRACEAKR